MNAWLKSLVIFGLFNCLLSFEAKSDTIQTVTIPSRKRVSIQFSPLALLDFNNGSSYRLGTQIRVSRRLALSADFGGYFRNFSFLKNNKGFYSYFAVKYALPENGSWLSISYSYKQQAFDYHDFYLQDPNTPITVHVQKYVNSISVNYERRIGQLFKDGSIDFFAGLGVRFRNVQSFQTKHQFDELKNGGDSQTLYLVLIPGNKAWLNLNFGLRIGFGIF